MFGKVWQFMAERYLGRDREIPKVDISMKLETKRAEPDSSALDTSVFVRWTIKLVLSNESSEPAADLKFVWPAGEPPFKATLPYHLSLYEEKVVPVHGETSVARQSLEEACPDELFRLLLGDTSLLLTYRDVRGDRYYTRYSRNDGRESVEFLKSLPQTD